MTARLCENGCPVNAPIARSILMTGCSTGIGRATALRLTGEGYRVFAGVRRPEDGDRLSRDAGVGLAPIALEVTDPESIERARSAVEEATAGAGLFALVNNAGISVGGPLELQAVDDLRRQLEVNAVGAMAVTRAFLPLLRRARGRVVNVSSGAGKLASPLLGAYCASKFALEALSDALRIELRRAGVWVVVVQPGLVRTPFVDKGRRDAADWRQRWSAEDEAYYGPPVDRYLEQIARLERVASEPEGVARVILRALEARRPRARYAAGSDVRMLLALRRWLPDRAVDALLARLTGF